MYVQITTPSFASLYRWTGSVSHRSISCGVNVNNIPAFYVIYYALIWLISWEITSGSCFLMDRATYFQEESQELCNTAVMQCDLIYCLLIFRLTENEMKGCLLNVRNSLLLYLN